jgi:hypothetical protein
MNASRYICIHQQGASGLSSIKSNDCFYDSWAAGSLLLQGAWCLLHGTWTLLLGAWNICYCTVHGTWSFYMVLGDMVLGMCYAVPRTCTYARNFLCLVIWYLILVTWLLALVTSYSELVTWYLVLIIR